MRNERRGVSRRLAAIGVAMTLAGAVLTGTATASEPRTGGGGAVPASFQAQSLSWVSAASGPHGWLLGSAPCGQRQCTHVLETANGGTSWHEVGQVPTRISGPGTHGVTEMRFADARFGWAYGPDLYVTRNAGRAWHASTIPGGGKQILALAAGHRATYAVVSGCAPGTGQCSDTPLTLWKTTGPHATHWTKLDVALPANIGADVAVYGSSVYVVDPLRPAAPDRFYASTDGHTFQARAVPCPDPADTALVDVVATSRTDVAMLCVGDPGMGHSTKTVFTSTDSGRTTTSAGQPDRGGISSALAASRGGDLVVTSVGGSPGDSYIYAKPTGESAWRTPVAKLGDGGRGWNDVVFSSRHTGWVIYGAANWGGPGRLLTTKDGGAHWKQVTLNS